MPSGSMILGVRQINMGRSVNAAASKKITTGFVPVSPAFVGVVFTLRETGGHTTFSFSALGGNFQFPAGSAALALAQGPNAPQGLTCDFSALPADPTKGMAIRMGVSNMVFDSGATLFGAAYGLPVPVLGRVQATWTRNATVGTAVVDLDAWVWEWGVGQAPQITDQSADTVVA